MKNSRRDFLMRCRQGAAAALVPGGLTGIASPFFYPVNAPPVEAAAAEFHLHPQYRTQGNLDATLLKHEAGHDEFETEKLHDKMAAKLEAWRSDLAASILNTTAINRALSPQFRGTSLLPASSRREREGQGLTVERVRFPETADRRADAFLHDWRQSVDGLAKVVTAEFQVTRVAASAAGFATTVRYELVSTGSGFHREQRVGNWELEWETVPGGEMLIRTWRAIEEVRSRSAAPFFVDVTQTALGGNASYAQQLSRGVDYWRTVLDGASGIDLYGHNGVSICDIDGDGFDDLYVCQPAGLPNRLYRNRGDGTFEDITESSGTGILDNTACALIADFDNDGRQDLVVVRASGPLLFLNQGGGKFRLKPDAFQFANPPQGTFTGAAAADYDRDGRLDIYFCLYVYYQGTDQYKYPVPYYDAQNGPPNFLMRNNGDGTFRDATAETGMDKNNNRYSFCCGWDDFNGDGWPDLYVVNDFGRKNLYRNNGDGTFTDVAADAGVEDTGAGMSVCWFDYDNAGRNDLYVADMWTAAGERISTQDVFQKEAPERTRSFYRKHAMGNSLFRNSGSGRFEDSTAPAQVGVGRWSWSSDAWDFDHDGFPDLYIANGMISGPLREDLNSFFWRQVVARSPAEAKASLEYEQGWQAINELIRADHSWSGYERNVFYANNRDGTFSDVSGAIGLDFVEDGRSFALADFDHDGRQEVFLKNRNAPQLRVLKNVIADLPPAIAFRLQGARSNRDAIGAAVTIDTGRGTQTKRLQAGSGFLAQHSKEIFFGLGEAKGPLKATIHWPSGIVQTLVDLPSNHRVWVEESGEAGAKAWRSEPFRAWSALHQEVLTQEPSEEDHLPRVVETWLLAPVTAPDFSLPDQTGQMRTLSALRGKPLLLHFCAVGSEQSERDLETLERRHPGWAARGLQLLTVNVGGGNAARASRLPFPIVKSTEDVAAIYNLLYRYVFERHRDLTLPTSFLIDEKSSVVKIYQGPLHPEHLPDHVDDDLGRMPRSAADRLKLALPFPGVADTYEFGRNHLAYGSVFFQRGYFDQAEEAFRLTLADDASSAEAHYGLGSVFLKRGDLAAARESFERVVSLKARFPDTLPNAWNNLGLLATREGKIDEAIQYFQQALRVSPEHWIALENLGNAYRQQHLWLQARQTLEQALAARPEDAEANYSLAMVYAQTEQPDLALEHFQKALRYRPVYPEALNNLGILYLRSGRRDEAVGRFEECIRVAPEFDQAYLNLARVYAVEGTPDKVRTVLEALLKQHPGHPQAQAALDQLR
jgi:tetratricopeptide (TPR) repeat protein/peroxiredoxin